MYRLSLILCFVMAGQIARGQHSFTIEGRVPAAWNGGVVRLYGEQQTPIDSMVISGGRFRLSPVGQAPMPQLMQLRIDVSVPAGGQGRSGRRDIFPAAGDAIVLDPGAVPVHGDLLAGATVRGSSLAHELEEYDRYLRPDGITPDPAILPAEIKSFILIHPGYWISLLKFGDLVRAGVVARAETRFANFPPELQRSELGQSVEAAIRGEADKVGPGRMAPDFAVQTADGKPFRLSDLRGKYVLLDFWASWCGPCRMENPNVLDNYRRFRDRNFTVLSFSLDDNVKPWREAIESDHLDWVHVSDLKAWHSDVVKNYNVIGVPKSFLLDPGGRIIAVDLRGDDLRKELEKLFQ